MSEIKINYPMQPMKMKRLRNGVLHRQRFVRTRNALVHGREWRLKIKWTPG